MIAEARNLCACLLAGLQQRNPVLDLDHLAVDVKLRHFYPYARLIPDALYVIKAWLAAMVNYAYLQMKWPFGPIF